MLAFRVEVNGKNVATIGFAGAHVTRAIIGSVCLTERDRRLYTGKPHPGRELDMDLSGMETKENGPSQHVRWTDDEAPHRRQGAIESSAAPLSVR